MSNNTAPPGQVWVCGACGKRSRDHFGNQALTPGWDESCMLNAVLCREDALTLNDYGVVTNVADGGNLGHWKEVEKKLRSNPAETAGAKEA